MNAPFVPAPFVPALFALAPFALAPFALVPMSAAATATPEAVASLVAVVSEVSAAELIFSSILKNQTIQIV